MSDFEERIARSGEALRAHAAGIEGEIHDVAVATRSRRWIVGGLSTIVVVVVAGAIVLAGGGGGVDEVTSVDAPGTVSLTSPPETSILATPVTSIVESETTANSGQEEPPEVAPFERPVFDAGYCETTRATETVVDSAVLFTRPSSMTLPIQVFGAPDATPADAFVVVERFFADQPTLGPGRSIEIDGTEATIRVFESGAGELVWDLADGSQAYIRSRNMTESELEKIGRSLQPRDTSEAVPGFDLPGPYVLIAEGIDGVDGRVATSYCTPEGFGEISVSAVLGDPLIRFGLAMDRPQTQLVLDDERGTLVFNALPDTPSEAVLNASEAEWADLLTAEA